MAVMKGFFLVFLPLLAAAATNTLHPWCKSKCGDIDIPYPFGIGDGCYAEEHGDFSITCASNGTAFLSSGNIDVVDISTMGELRIHGLNGYECYDREGNSSSSTYSFDLGSLPFTFSETKNKFFIIGCDTYAFINGEAGVNYSSGCMSYCENKDSFRGLPHGSCSGLGCCEVSIPRGIKGFSTDIRSFDNYTRSMAFNRCGFVFLAEEGKYNFKVSDLSSERMKTQTLPLVLDWSISNLTCAEAIKSQSYACRSSNSHCMESNNGVGYLCNCTEGYVGNPYLLGGCQDIDECAQSHNICPSGANCTNTPGSYTCKCRAGYKHSANSTGECEDIDECRENPCSRGEYCENTEGSYECKSRNGGISLALKLGLGIGGALLFLLAASSFTCWGRQRKNLSDQTRKVAEFKQRMFEQNGGPLLQQQVSSRPGNSFRIFTEEELATATEGFADKQIIGRGGHGVVYLGKLEDNTAVAVKKSKRMDERESKEFAREMAILSQINHVNIVKILGCCIEVEVPMLVYEFVPGGTLYDLIHGQKGRTPISFRVCLRIAQEVAEAIAYLHSYASPPILHKDIKTFNVLLDENNKAKISDFGASSVAPVDEYEIATIVQGTCGYLDPEYLQTYQFSDKSDVYSFGVVLLELLTRRKPLQLQGPEDQKALATTFISYLNQGKLDSILDAQIKEEASAEMAREIAELAARCIYVKRDDRPTMKEVSMALQILGSTREHQWVPWHAPSASKSLLDPDLSVACDSVDVPTSYLGTHYHPIPDIEAGR